MNFSSAKFSSEDTMYNKSGSRLSNGSSFGPPLPPSSAKLIEEFIYTKMILAVCLFGIGGNLLNLIILSQKSLVCTMKRMEKSAHYGLIALAVSDLFVCLTALPAVFYGTGNSKGGFQHASFDFRLVYKLYGQGVINTFMLSSTWLTVATAISRYIAICHPLRARQIIGRTFTVASLVAVALGSVLFNVPRFLRDEPRSHVGKVTGGRLVYFVFPGPMRHHPGVQRAYSWSYFTLGIALPLFVLVFSNAKLVLALRSSKKLRADTSCARQPTSERRTSPDNDDHHGHDKSARRITLTLIVIIIFFVLLFVPAELLNFFMEHAVGDVYNTGVFNMAQAVGNLLQAVNFAVNFVLYCAVNTHFRQTVYRLMQAPCCRRSPTSEAASLRPESRARPSDPEQQRPIATVTGTQRSKRIYAQRNVTITSHCITSPVRSDPETANLCRPHKPETEFFHTSPGIAAPQNRKRNSYALPHTVARSL